jgi:hypothetical protein
MLKRLEHTEFLHFLARLCIETTFFDNYNVLLVKLHLLILFGYEGLSSIDIIRDSRRSHFPPENLRPSRWAFHTLTCIFCVRFRP